MKTALGRGLEALLPEGGEEIIAIDIERIVPAEHQPRKTFREESLRELAQSIKEKGILQPVIVTRTGDGTFRLIAGERRCRAAHQAGLKKIPALVREVSSADAIEIALIENIQREDLNPVETAEAFHRLLKDHALTQEELSQRVGKDRTTIANHLRILRLPEDVKALINNGSLSMGHAKAILTIEGKNKQSEAARAIVRKGLNVRAAEVFCKNLLIPAPSKKKKKARLPEVAELEERLIRSLGTKVRIKHKGKKGSIEIDYYSLDELDRLLEILLKSKGA
jgi:ParB family chromosome partitioning protein